jgi:hypothetical protein
MFIIDLAIRFLKRAEPCGATEHRLVNCAQLPKPRRTP